jgi:FkbM family methyltransferase
MNHTFKSETGVDKWIRENIFTDYEYKGIMIEVGAATPDYISNSYHWRENGWRTICIEPNPYFVELHKKVGSEVYQYACSDSNLDNVDFIVIGNNADDIDSNSFHSFSHIADVKMEFDDMASNWKEAYEYSNKEIIKVNVRTLNTILEELKIDKIDILSIDVEGAEKKVLDGLNLSFIKPTVIILENLSSSFNFDSILKHYGYQMVEKINQDEIFKLI